MWYSDEKPQGITIRIEGWHIIWGKISSDTFSFLREKLEYDQELREKELKLKKEERTEVRDAMIQQQSLSNEVLQSRVKQILNSKLWCNNKTSSCIDDSTAAADANFHGTT